MGEERVLIERFYSISGGLIRVDNDKYKLDRNVGSILDWEGWVLASGCVGCAKLGDDCQGVGAPRWRLPEFLQELPDDEVQMYCLLMGAHRSKCWESGQGEVNL